MTLSAVLLAGGESRRMGTNKAEVIIEGEKLWQRQLRLLRQLEPEGIFFSAREDPDWRPREIELVLDESPSRGPMSGISAALARMKTSHLLVLAVDMPFLNLNDLLKLVSLTKAGCGVVPVTDGRAQPLVAIYPEETRSEFTVALSSSDQSMKRLINQLVKAKKVDFLYLSPAEAERYRSVNTPEHLLARPACR